MIIWIIPEQLCLIPNSASNHWKQKPSPMQSTWFYGFKLKSPSYCMIIDAYFQDWTAVKLCFSAQFSVHHNLEAWVNGAP